MSERIIEWLILFGGVIALAYAMRVIGREKKTYIEDSISFTLGNFRFPIASWWTLLEQDSNKMLYFERTDTYYDWWTRWIYQPEDDGKDLNLVMEAYLEKESIQFDEDVAIQTESKYLFRNQEIAAGLTEAIRVEGTATEKGIDRTYYDLVLFRENGKPGYYFLISRSSVLNGSLEGPYFEEAFRRIEKA